MYDILAHPYQPQPDMINKSAGVVNDPAIDLGYARLHEEKLQRAAKQKEDEDKLHAQNLDRKLSKIKDSVRPADQEAIGKLQEEYRQTVLDNIDKYNKGDTKAILAINDAERNINSIIDQSNQLYQKETAISHNLKGNEYGFDDWNKSTQTSYVGSSDSYVNHIPKPKMELQKEWNNEYVPGLIKEGGMDGKANYNPDGSITYTDLVTLDPAKVDAAKEKMFRDSPNAASEIHNQFHYEKTPNDPSSLKTRYAYQDQEGEKLDYKQAFKDALYTPESVAKARTTAQPSPASLGNSDSQKKVNLTPLKDRDGNVVGFNAQSTGGSDTREWATISIPDKEGHLVPTKVRVESAMGDNVKVSIPKNAESVKTWEGDKSKWKNAEIKAKVKANKFDQAGKDAYMTAWYNANKFPEYPAEYTSSTTINGEQAEDAWHQAYGMSLNGAYKGDIPKHVRVDKGNVVTPEQKSDKKTWQEMNGVTPKKKITGF